MYTMPQTTRQGPYELYAQYKEFLDNLFQKFKKELQKAVYDLFKKRLDLCRKKVEVSWKRL